MENTHEDIGLDSGPLQKCNYYTLLEEPFIHWPITSSFLTTATRQYHTHVHTSNPGNIMQQQDRVIPHDIAISQQKKRSKSFSLKCFSSLQGRWTFPKTWKTAFPCMCCFLLMANVVKNTYIRLSKCIFLKINPMWDKGYGGFRNISERNVWKNFCCHTAVNTGSSITMLKFACAHRTVHLDEVVYCKYI